MGLFGFGKKEAVNVTAPENDAEKWVIATYAMWSSAAEGDWHYIAGSPSKSKQEGASMRVMLRRDWEISNKGQLLDQVSYMTSLYAEGTGSEQEDIENGAWDLCRACQILAMGFVGGYIERQEMMAESMKVGCIMQKYYHSWNELYDSYIKGYRKWRMGIGGDASKDIADREALCSRLLEMADGPCTVAWDTAL